MKEVINTHKIELSDVTVSLGNDNLIGNVIGLAREAVSESGSPGVLVFIPTRIGETFLDTIKVVE